MEGYYPIFQQYQALREQLMEIVTDEELGYTPGGENPTLGALCLEVGEVEVSYIESFKTFKQDFAFRNEEAGLEGSVERLAEWFRQLDQELELAIEALSDDDIQNRTIEHSPSVSHGPQIQLEVYKEALLIFYGKVSVYLKAMGKPRPKQWREWIA
jgi:uncharacterized damage-inducible protein DinB